MWQYDFDTVYDRRGTGCFKTDALEMLYGKGELLPLWVADMDFAVAPEIQEAMEERLKHPIFGYNLRLPPYYEAVIHWVEKRYGWQIKKEWIINTPGIVTAVNIAVLTQTSPGDGVLVQTPVYDPFFESAQGNGRRLVTSPLVLKDGRYGIDFDDFEQKLKQCKLFILCSPHNPVGRVWTRDELLQMGRLCARHKVRVVADEIHADLVYSGYQHIPFGALEDFSGFTLACYSPSKSFNLAGLSNSAIVIPDPEVRQAFNDYVQTMHLFIGNTFGIVALEAAYTKGEAWLEALLEYLETSRDALYKFMQAEFPRLNMIRPEGTFLSWIDCRGLGLNDDELLQRLVRKGGLAVSPGRIYGQEGSGFIRLNFACPRAILEKTGLGLLKAFKQEDKTWN